MKLKPFAEILVASKEKLEELRAPLKVRAARVKAESYIISLEEKLANFESELNTLATSKELDFEKMADIVDEMELVTHRKDRVEDILSQLFPVEEK